MDVWNREINQSVKGKYVRNFRQPKGSIVESYIYSDEAIEFCTEYMVDCEAIGLPKKTLTDSLEVKGNSAIEVKKVDSKDLQLAQLYILHNTTSLDLHVAEHLAYLGKWEKLTRRKHKYWFKMSIINISYLG